jgi:hypothetical protein
MNGAPTFGAGAVPTRTSQEYEQACRDGILGMDRRKSTEVEVSRLDRLPIGHGAGGSLSRSRARGMREVCRESVHLHHG